MQVDIDKIINYWSFASPPRKTQIQAFDWLEQNLDKRYLFIEMPVGGGKSNLGITYSKFRAAPNGNSFILTPQKILQTQYEQTFPSDILASLYGKNNYRCNNKNTTCDIGSIVKPRCSSCAYEMARAKAKNTPNVVFNYTFAMLSFGYTQVFDKRSLMILDECHNLEDHLTEFDAITITEHKAKKFGIDWTREKTFDGVFKWISSVYKPAAREHLENLFKSNEYLLDKSGYDITPAELKRLREMSALEDHLDSVEEFTLAAPLDVRKNEYVLIQDPLTVKFKRLTGAHTFKRIIEPKADQFLFLSSTILNYKAFCKDIGIDDKQAAFISLDSEFPPENRPVYYMPKMKMNASWMSPENKNDRELMLQSTAEIAELHKDDSGIIHTANFQIARWLVEQLKDKIPHEILHHNPESGDYRNDIIEAFQMGKHPKILISPSITEGLDFKDDLSRFAIFAKVPFGYLGDQWIKRRMELSQEWYMRRALIDVIQGAGRVVRTAEDWGHVYILDASFQYLLNQTKFMVPDWWMKAYRVIKT